MIKFRTLLQESQIAEESLNSYFDLEDVEQQLTQQFKSEEQDLNEDLGFVSVLGMILAVPAVLKGLSMMIEKGNRLVSSKLTKEQLKLLKQVSADQVRNQGKSLHFTSGLADVVDSIAERLHHLYVHPIEKLFAKIAKLPGLRNIKWLQDHSKRHKLAEAIYIIFALYLGGYGLAAHAASVTGAIDAIKVADTGVAATILANRLGLLKQLPKIVVKLLS